MPDWPAPHPIDCRADHGALAMREECVSCKWCPEDRHEPETRIVGPGQLVGMCPCHWIGPIREGDAARVLAKQDGADHVREIS